MNKPLSKAFLTIFFSVASLSASAANYSLTLLDGLDGSYSYAKSINNLGQIVGQSYGSTSSGHATLWNNGVATDLNPQGSSGSYANSINNLGQIVGQLNDPFGNSAIVWNNGVATQLNGPQGSSFTANAINNLGLIVGVSGTYSNTQATLWNNWYGVEADLNLQFGGISYATSINDSGQIVGYSYDYSGVGSGNKRATLWNSSTVWSNGVATQLNHSLGSVSSSANSINNLGQIVGYSTTADDTNRATLWNNGVATDLHPQGSIFSVANSINDLGQIVGYSATSNDSRATLWNNGVATDLNSFLSASDQSEGWVLINALDINDNGSIVGNALNTVSYAERGFLLQSVAAVPEADTSAMLLMGAGVMGFMAKRKKNLAV